jgi:2-C-methyl-D-erythritol 2,4-cyclodiphosphate synthase
LRLLFAIFAVIALENRKEYIEAALRRYLKLIMRIGFGNDIHRLVAGRPLKLGGVTIESDLGADGHSDADALTHAVTDALLGALALGDIGQHFSDKDPRWNGADSFVFLAEALRLIKEKGYAVGNVDSVIELESPKLRPHIETMRANLAKVLEVAPEYVSVKAKTGEEIGIIGTRKAVKAHAVVLLTKMKN